MGFPALVAALLLAGTDLPALQLPLLPPAERLQPVPARDVHLAATSFWGPRVATNLLVSLQHGAAMLEEHGQFGNFRMAASKQGHALPAGDVAPDKYAGCFYYDSDAYKWLEACCLALAQDAPEGTDPQAVATAKADIRLRVDRFVEEIAAAQREDGYLNTQYLVEGWTPFSKLGSDHELYCAGHLVQAAIAHHDATGNRRLIDAALRFAELIDRTFGPDASKDQRPGCCGHPELETALVQLFHHTGEKRWLDLAAFMLECRGKGLAGGDDYRQDDKPIREQREARGHAVRQLYLCSGVLGVGAETGDAGLLRANDSIWRDIVAGKLYVTGGLGARADGEAFGAPFELPNERAYSETCASIAWMRWNHELLSATGHAQYANALETTLYNAFLASTGKDGKSFFYVNPLESRGGHARQPWYWCACCPPNVMRTFAGLPGWFASTTQDALIVHLYDDCTIDATLGDGRKLKVGVETDWPWDGEVRVRLLEVPDGELTLALRLPDCGRIEGVDVVTRTPEELALRQAFTPDGFVRLSGRFHADDFARLRVDLAPRWIAANPRVTADVGQAVLAKGPVIYAFESRGAVSRDPDPRDEPSLDGVVVDTNRPVSEELPSSAGLGSPAPILSVSVLRSQLPYGALYSSLPASVGPVTLAAHPYHGWAQRGDTSLRTWMPCVPTLPSFADDVDFLRQHADAVVLQAEGCGPLVVSPRLSGRVMTSALQAGQPGFGLVNRDAIRTGPVKRGFANYGGEDRLWLSPEGGPFALFFRGQGMDDGDTWQGQTPDSWSVPVTMDGGPRATVRQDGRSIAFADRMELANVAGTAFTVATERSIEALSRADVGALLAHELPAGVEVVGFRSSNRLSWATAPPADTLVGLWTLGQFKPGEQCSVRVPFRGDAAGADGTPAAALAAAIKKDYFGDVPAERLKLLTPTNPQSFGLAIFRADSRLRSKIGLSRAGATGWIGAWDADRGVLTLVQHSLPPVGAPVPDCDWRVPNPRAAQGDVATSYNNGGEPAFFELESLSAALPCEPGASVEHVSTTIHLGGERDVLRDIARTVLHAEL